MKFPTRAVAVLALLVAPPAVMAQDYPSRPIHLIMPMSPGGATDMIVRAMVPSLSATLQEALVVENQPGAGSIVGTAAIAKSAADGYTVGVASSAALAANPHMHKELPYDPAKDFTPVCRIGGSAYVLVVNPSLGVKTLPELLARAKSERLSIASAGQGSSTHMAQEMLKVRVGASFLHVPYKGTAPAINDTLAGHSQALFEAPAPLLPHIRSGKLIPLVVTSGRRVDSLPDVPTLEELGYKDARLEGWVGLMVRAGTPAPIVTRLSQACQTALATPELKSQAQSLSFDINYAPSAEFAPFIESERQKWGELLRAAGVRPE
ncbi:Bug family tripartite tricarboxylate transporter substrate binding protein [Pseudorhodoferax sp.]|uniref:Bug family tripartite tricarboxylate transporter substrate binding protein n=1 Tax=Pseudorhodoferax sp. TaxID=1993553 RepID=UPI0039E3BF21